MTFGDDDVHACPACAAPFRVFTLQSANNLGDTYWTDGYVSRPMMWRPSALTRCHACRGFFWLEDAPRLGTLPGPRGPGLEVGLEDKDGSASGARTGVPAERLHEWKSSPMIRGLGLEEHYEALESGAGSTEERDFLARLMAFWASSDKNRIRRRKKDRQKTPEDVRSMRALLARAAARFTARGSHGDACLGAEIHRQLGEFDQARAWLRRIGPRTMVGAHVEAIGRLAAEANRAVAEVDVRSHYEAALDAAVTGKSLEPLLIVERTRVVLDGMGEYHAYFAKMPGKDGPDLEDLATQAGQLGAELLFTPSGRPFKGMACHLTVRPLTRAEADELTERFDPERDDFTDGL